jgi:GNAT superfamily N-acetyltransferase
MQMTIRPAEKADVELLFDIRTSVRENYQSREEIATLGITPDSIAQLLETDAAAWICEIDRMPVGFSMANARQQTVFALFVRPEYEGRGAGRALLTAAENWLFDKGIREIWLTTGANETLRAYGFYRHLGWLPSGKIDDGLVKYIERAADRDRY